MVMSARINHLAVVVNATERLKSIVKAIMHTRR